MSSVPYFNAVATQWDRMRSAFFSPRVRDAAVAAAGVRAGGRALDVGAGSGFLSEGLLAAGASVVAIDVSPAMMAALRERFPAVDARVGDAERIPAPGAEFDAALANMCLHHVERPAVAIREMARVVRSGGAVVVTDLEPHAHEFLRVEHHDRWMGFAHEDVARWMREAGLREVEVTSLPEDCCATSECGSETAKVTIFLARGVKP